MSKRRIPSFADEVTHELRLGGRTLVFHAVSGPVLLRVQHRLGGPFAAVLHALFTGDAEAIQKALAALLEKVSEHGQAVGLLVLDALHDEEWLREGNERVPLTPALVDQFLAATSGPALVAMLAAVAAVNAKAFAPFARGLLADLTGAARGASSPETTQDGSAESSS